MEDAFYSSILDQCNLWERWRIQSWVSFQFRRSTLLRLHHKLCNNSCDIWV